jgi:hypothetical protein
MICVDIVPVPQRISFFPRKSINTKFLDVVRAPFWAKLSRVIDHKLLVVQIGVLVVENPKILERGFITIIIIIEGFIERYADTATLLDSRSKILPSHPMIDSCF